MTSTYLESLRVRQESAATSGSAVVPATALGILLAVACHSSSPILSVQRTIHQVGRTLGTLTQPASRQIAEVNENDLVRELSRVYAELVVDQAEMNEAVRSAIYSDLWGLYD